MSEIWRDKDDKRNFSPSCLVTALIFSAALILGLFFLANFVTEKCGDLLKMTYPYVSPFMDKDVTAEEQAEFSNSWFRIADCISRDPLILTNSSVMIIKNVVLDRSVSKEEIADLKKLAERLEENE
jgi:hypothetical protein